MPAKLVRARENDIAHEICRGKSHGCPTRAAERADSRETTRLVRVRGDDRAKNAEHADSRETIKGVTSNVTGVDAFDECTNDAEHARRARRRGFHEM